MRRLTREWGEWVALAEDLHDEIYLAHSYQVGPSRILSQAHVSEGIIYEWRRGVNQ
jgi:hypothetical protein